MLTISYQWNRETSFRNKILTVKRTGNIFLKSVDPLFIFFLPFLISKFHILSNNTRQILQPKSFIKKKRKEI